MNETLVGDAWIVSVLNADEELSGIVSGVFQTQAPQNTPFPYVIVDWLGGSDITVIEGIRVWHSGVWLVKVVDQAAGFGRIAPAEQRIDLLLHRQSGTVDGGIVYSVVREAPFRLTETDGGVRYVHLGGRYRVEAQTS